MTRYQALRSVGCGRFAAGFIAFCNWLAGYPPNRIVFLTVELELPTDGVTACTSPDCSCPSKEQCRLTAGVTEVPRG